MAADSRSRQNRKTQYRTINYVDGSTVRKLEAVPKAYPARKAVPARRLEKQRQENQRIAQRNREKALRIDLGYLFFLGAAVVVTLASCIWYLSLQNTVTRTGKEVAVMKSEVASLADENMATQERINSSIDLGEVYDTATGELGMVYTKEDQIIHYKSSNSDYVKQYGDIPSAE